jgi:two-component system, cell cycle sensor histidine kinase and response regulator CckA
MTDTPQATHTILLVENEPAIRQLIRRMLEQRGFHVLEARHGKEAAALADGYREPIHLLLTDIVMPGMTGFELAGHLALAHPEARVLFLSGYGDSARVRQGLEGSHQAFLLKPFTQDVLGAKIQEVLAS